MALPAGINNTWLTTIGIPEEAIDRARRLSLEDRFAGSNMILEEYLAQALIAGGEEYSTAVDALTLYGWNILFLRDEKALQQFFEDLDAIDLTDYPGILVIEYWWLLRRGFYDEVLGKCHEYIERHICPISVHIGQFLFLQGYAEAKIGDLGAAESHCEMAYSIFELVSDHINAAWAGNYLGITQIQCADYQNALKWFDRTLALYMDPELPLKQSMVHLNIGITHYKIGDYGAAFEHLNQSHKIGVDGNWIHRQCFTNIALGNAHRLTRDNEAARKHLHTAYSQAQELQSPREEALALEFLGDVYRDEGAPREARRFYARAMAIGTRIAPEGDIVMELHRRIGECQNHEGHHGEALTSLNKALKMANAQGDRFEAAVTQRVMCETTINAGDLKSARKYIDESVTTLAEVGARHEHAISLLTSVTLALQEVEDPRTATPRIVRLNQAWKQATKALELFIKVDVPWWTAKGRAAVARVSALRDAQEKADKEAMATGNIAKPGSYNPGEVIIHQSRLMRDMIQLCDMFATTDEPVLITGETGTGKEVVAKRLHAFSDRAEKPLVIVNVAAIPETMFEREFFGHVRGAFSGATQNGEGYAARANGGTLFLDEIGDLPLDLQPKLLRLLQERTYQALGDPKQRRTDIRLVAATNANLEQKVREGTFRADLYYRLRTLDLPLPPVRDRSEDVLPLMRHFLCVAAKRPVDLAEYFSPPTIDALEAYDWPGNVREIAMVARQSHVSLKALGRVDLKIRRHDNAPLRLTGPGLLEMEAEAGVVEVLEVKGPVLTQSETVERARILVALDEAGENRHIAAKALGIGRSTLYRRMEKYGIPTRRV